MMIINDNVIEKASYEKAKKILLKDGFLEEIIDCYLNDKSLDYERIKYRIYNSAINQLSQIIRYLGDDFLNKPILDLGCGSVGKTIEFNTYGVEYHPWLCRIINELDGNITGVDIGNLSNERFDHYNINLLSNDSLKKFKDNFFDLINANLLFTSPELEFQISGKVDKVNASANSAKLLYNHIFPEIDRVLQPEGYFIYTDYKDLELVKQSLELSNVLLR